jgi:anhydro-N-acetylmuramic acid kinase
MRYFIGLMSGSSLDGVDAVLVEIGEGGAQFKLLASSYLPFSTDIREALLALQSRGFDEVQRVTQAANQLMVVYADCVLDCLKKAGIPSQQIIAISAHGQTVRHRPEFGYTLQINNPALLAELTDIDVIADFRSRDIAAGGQGAPLIPAFHRSAFGQLGETRVVVNIGGIGNISILRADGSTSGFDTGPGNILMDSWIMQHQSQTYDVNGAWARQGKVNRALLEHLKDDAFLRQAPPKSTGRELFHAEWLEQKLTQFNDVSPTDVQATLCALTAHTLVDAIIAYAPDVHRVFICGGGAYNTMLMDTIKLALDAQTTQKVRPHVSVDSTEVLGIAPNHVEAMGFAWLAYRYTKRLTGNLVEVTGASGERVLGALYPR